MSEKPTPNRETLLQKFDERFGRLKPSQSTLDVVATLSDENLEDLLKSRNFADYLRLLTEKRSHAFLADAISDEIKHLLNNESTNRQAQRSKAASEIRGRSRATLEKPDAMMGNQNPDLFLETKHASLMSLNLPVVGGSPLPDAPTTVSTTVLTDPEMKSEWIQAQSNSNNLVFALKERHWTIVENRTGLTNAEILRALIPAKLHDLWIRNHPAKRRLQ